MKEGLIFLAELAFVMGLAALAIRASVAHTRQQRAIAEASAHLRGESCLTCIYFDHCDPDDTDGADGYCGHPEHDTGYGGCWSHSTEWCPLWEQVPVKEMR